MAPNPEAVILPSDTSSVVSSLLRPPMNTGSLALVPWYTLYTLSRYAGFTYNTAPVTMITRKKRRRIQLEEEDPPDTGAVDSVIINMS